MPQDSPFETREAFAPRGRIDSIALDCWKRRGIAPSRMCPDALFFRRAHLDLTGAVPAAAEARRFLQDRHPWKRRDLVETLLQREEHADFWAMRWCDALRVKSEYPVNLWPNAVQAYHHWIRESVRSNLPYDRFVRALLTSSGSCFRSPAVNFYRAVPGREPAQIAKAVALTFMGARAERWPAERLQGMAGFFSQIGFKSTGEWKEEIVFHDPSLPVRHPLVFPDGAPARIPPGRDPRSVFADWLLRPGNPWLARSIANRVWAWLFGRGIVHEPDDIRPDNPPSIPALLPYLESELVAAKWDLRQLIRLILSSGVYQLSPIPRSRQPGAEAVFARFPVRRLEAEVLIDAIIAITGAAEGYSSAVPEPFTFIPSNQTAVSIADGSISSAFLDLFGRPPRDSGLFSERSGRSTAAQRLHLLNSSHIRQKLERGPVLAALIRASRNAGEAAESLYLAVLSRFPTDFERETAAAYIDRPGTTLRDGAIDIAWALINSAEFVLRH